MNLRLGILIIAILIVDNTSAQKIGVGIKGGLNFYNIHNSNNTKYDGRTGLYRGLFSHIRLTKKLAILPELVYSSQGAKNIDLGVEVKLKLSYINIPLIIQYMFAKGFKIQAGPQIGFLINATNNSNGSLTNVGENVKDIEFALVTGLSYLYKEYGFGVDIRYNLGLTKINKDVDSKITNRGFQLGVFYLFHHK